MMLHGSLTFDNVDKKLIGDLISPIVVPTIISTSHKYLFAMELIFLINCPWGILWIFIVTIFITKKFVNNKQVILLYFK